MFVKYMWFWSKMFGWCIGGTILDILCVFGPYRLALTFIPSELDFSNFLTVLILNLN